MGLFDDIKDYLSVAVSDPAEQFIKGLANKATGIDFEQTEESFEPEVVDAIRVSVSNALKAGRKGTEYEDYEPLDDGTPVGEFVRSDKSRTDFVKKIANNPQAEAALSVGRGSIEIDDNNDVYFTDKYNFSGSSSNKGDDAYSTLRKVAGKVMTEDEGETAGNSVRIYLGKLEDVLKPEKKKKKDAVETAIAKVTSSLDDMAYDDYIVKSGDTLSQIAKKNKTTVAKLVEQNNITDPDKIYAGQKIIV
jgi:LysM repeat protein